MSRRTRRALLLAAPVALAVLAVALGLLWARTAITRENAAKVKAGMTLAEVEQVLGGPARDETTGLVAYAEYEAADGGPETVRRWNALRRRVAAEPGLARMAWVSDEVWLETLADADGRVVLCARMPVRRIDGGPIAAVRRWLGR